MGHSATLVRRSGMSALGGNPRHSAASRKKRTSQRVASEGLRRSLGEASREVARPLLLRCSAHASKHHWLCPWVLRRGRHGSGGQCTAVRQEPCSAGQSSWTWLCSESLVEGILSVFLLLPRFHGVGLNPFCRPPGGVHTGFFRWRLQA